jgi:hypothetical protein
MWDNSNNYEYVGFEVLTAVVMKSIKFWDITPCSPSSVNRRFGGTYRLHLQGRKISWARNQRGRRWQAPVGFEVLTAVVMKSTIFWDIKPCSPLTLNGLHGVISQTIVRSACHLLSRWFLAQFIFSTLKMEAICSFEASVDTEQTTRRYIPEDSTFCLPPAFTLVSCSADFLDSDDGGDMFLRNVGWHSTDYTALYPRRWYSSTIKMVFWKLHLWNVMH